VPGRARKAHLKARPRARLCWVCGFRGRAA